MYNKRVSCQFLLTAWIAATNLRSTFGANISRFYAFGRFTIILPIKISANYQELAIESRNKSILVQGQQKFTCKNKIAGSTSLVQNHPYLP